MNKEQNYFHLFKEQGVVFLDVIEYYEKKDGTKVAGFITSRLDLVQDSINRTIKEIEKDGSVVFEWGQLEESKRFCYYFKFGKVI